MTNTNNEIEALRTFAVANNEMAFAHLCTAALNGEGWAIGRVNHVITAAAAYRNRTAVRGPLALIRDADTARPDGAVARSFEI
jgi:hypothetical protein